MDMFCRGMRLQLLENVTSISEVVGDTTPQLGGDLDVNGNSISVRALMTLT